MRDVSCRKVAATIFWPPARTIAPVAGSRSRVSTAFFSVQPRVALTALSCAATMRSSPPTIAIRDTDFGALSVTSRPGRCVRLPSSSLRPRRRPPGTSPSRTRRNASGSTGPSSPSASAPLPAQALASRCAPSSLRAVAVLLEIPHALRRRGDLADRGHHAPCPPRLGDRGRPADAGMRDSGRSIRARYALAGRRTRAEQAVSSSCHRMAAIVHPCRDFPRVGACLQHESLITVC